MISEPRELFLVSTASFDVPVVGKALDEMAEMTG